jgi:NAD(P)-dependent dehydrogenase (short-subunit alcohol dehydrogenase family)
MRTALITGASRGLGLALSRRFLEDGWRVIGISRTRTHWVSARRTVAPQTFASLLAVELTSESAVKRLASRLKGDIPYLLINNAGYGSGLMRIEKTSLLDYRRQMDGNLLSAFLMCKHFIPLFRRRRQGFILNVSSMAGQRAVPGAGIYSAAKFGVLALSQAVAKENADSALKCVTVCPGGMNTGMRAKYFGKADAARQQSADYVAGVIRDVVDNKIKVESGGDIVIRHGKITAIHPCPAA